MCIIAATYQPDVITDELFDRMWAANPDGGGFTYIKDDKFVIVKELTHKDKFKKLWKKHRIVANRLGSPMLLHFRVGTMGGKNTQNLHPFLVNRDCIFAHNGTISAVSCLKGMSDTKSFCERILKELPIGFEQNHGTLSLLKHYIGGGSKLVFLTLSTREFTFVNEAAGSHEKEMQTWFSNSGYKGYSYGLGQCYWKKEPAPFVQKPLALESTTTKIGTHTGDNIPRLKDVAPWIFQVPCEKCGLMLEALNPNVYMYVAPEGRVICEECVKDVVLEGLVDQQCTSEYKIRFEKPWVELFAGLG